MPGTAESPQTRALELHEERAKHMKCYLDLISHVARLLPALRFAVCARVFVV